MPTDDVQIHVAGAASIPLSYTVPGNGQLQPKAVSAVFDGSGASGNFLPVLEIISDGGIVVASCPAPVVAAGASAEVSWFPHVGGAAAAAGTVVEWFYATRATNLTLPSGATTFVPWTAHQTSNSSLFSITSTHGPNTGITVAQPGVCVASFYVIQNPFNATWPMHLFLNSTGARSAGTASYDRMNSTDGPDPVTSNPYDPRDYRLTVAQTAPFDIYAEAVNDDVGSQTIGYAEVGVFFWPNATLIV